MLLYFQSNLKKAAEPFWSAFTISGLSANMFSLHLSDSRYTGGT